jgi:hypothetical protein
LCASPLILPLSNQTTPSSKRSRNDILSLGIGFLHATVIDFGDYNT